MNTNTLDYNYCGNGFGFVLHVWDGNGQPVYATHGARFNTASERPALDTLYSGNYFTDEASARTDYAKRCQRGY